MKNPAAFPAPAELRRRIHEHLRCDEDQLLDELIAKARFTSAERERISQRAAPLIEKVRAERTQTGGIDAFMNTYDLSSREGIVLMCLAEALLRIPDAETQDLLIKDKIGPAEWEKRLGASHSLFVNASTWGLMLTGRVVKLDNEEQNLGGVLKRLVNRLGEPVIRQAVLTGMKILGKQFVMGRNIGEALERSRDAEKKGYRHSYDMLGESARTTRDAQRYFESYAAAITAIGQAANGRPAHIAPSISIKLSALHPRYEVAQQDRVMSELAPAVKALAQKAKAAGIGFTIDAEEVDRLELSLDLIEFLALDAELAGWNGLGLAVQAYQKRALPVIDWLAELAQRANRRLMVRLVKGAYWDAEIKLAQERGLSDYPVFTRKASTDVSYLACAKRLLADPVAFYPAFATHNAHTLAAIAEIATANGREDWEYQRLHGMGEELYDEVVGEQKWNKPCRVYAPVGSHEDLLAYLVRRLLENGANTSFVNRIADAALPLATLLADPVEATAALPQKRASRIPLPRELYRAFSQTTGAQVDDRRDNSQGLDMFDQATLQQLSEAIALSRKQDYLAAPIIDGRIVELGQRVAVRNPADRREVIGYAVIARDEDVNTAMQSAAVAQRSWDATPAFERAAKLERAAALMEQRIDQLTALIVREGGRTQGDAMPEVREAIDFLRYYAKEARQKFADPIPLPGPTGEKNTLQLHGRGVFVCISPWNFPLAIFVGQLAAALAAGNTVVAKPAEQTPLIADVAVKILHEAGVPGPVLHVLPGDGKVGAAMVASPYCAGVAFTGSTEVAKLIATTLATKPGAIVPLIAETGGQNALIADSSALPEQIVRDVVASAFNSAGQRCSALRVLFVQADIADKVNTMLAGAMKELRLGDPADIRTDVGPVIDEEARANLEAHARKLDGFATRIQVIDADVPVHGTYFAPRAYEIDSLSRLEREVFGPILHVIRWHAGELDQVCDAIAATGYGLTLGIHSRIDDTVKRITERLHVGNTYVNRNLIGAVVGVQPFGGEGLSGTGPKAGGPHYLYRFACERTISVDTTAAGGNASLMAVGE
ncbi:MAG TPA: bifunctional proline dehydrogenase/L-glutamate gamma-semialdehyde dehydrogenase PutA [Rhodocyclaceae bacterium]|nr:bifunctional proline dehydrogenase/L-glutamate gamma-semialdehyde dehydrogenase PutA [Rhodocyclaceae bacterium]